MRRSTLWLLVWLLGMNILFMGFYLMPDTDPSPSRAVWKGMTQTQCNASLLLDKKNINDNEGERVSEKKDQLLAEYVGPEILRKDFIRSKRIQRIPPIIHQTYKTRHSRDWNKRLKKWFESWDRHNQGHMHFIWDDSQAQHFIRFYFTDRIYNAYSRLPRIVQKTDLLRYALLYYYGGYYADSDTLCYRPVDEWPMEFRGCNVTFIAGLEWDSEVGRSKDRERIQLSQWAMASIPEHPILRAVINHVVDTAMSWPMEKLMDVENVLELSGPLPWTNKIADFLSLYGRNLDEMHGIGASDAKLFPGGVLILPSSSFNWPYEGYEHSERALLRHYVNGYSAGGWRNA